jgi:hypothetical protein
MLMRHLAEVLGKWSWPKAGAALATLAVVAVTSGVGSADSRSRSADAPLVGRGSTPGGNLYEIFASRSDDGLCMEFRVSTGGGKSCGIHLPAGRALATVFSVYQGEVVIYPLLRSDVRSVRVRLGPDSAGGSRARAQARRVRSKRLPGRGLRIAHAALAAPTRPSSTAGHAAGAVPPDIPAVEVSAFGANGEPLGTELAGEPPSEQ